jgi:hypothetical protein
LVVLSMVIKLHVLVNNLAVVELPVLLVLLYQAVVVLLAHKAQPVLTQEAVMN